MSFISFDILIPLDTQGFMELECDYCKNRFMVLGDEFKNGDFLHMFCPVCGIPNHLNTFYTTEVIEKSHEIITQWAIDQIQKTLGASIKSLNKNKFIKVDMKIPKVNSNLELYEASNCYLKVNLECCNIDLKIREIDHLVGAYCPKCGGCHI
ncbi:MULTISPECIES: hypothetical protein [Paenibacillus]|uniref:hypothetical protein n=1 Tax=Paenibacillus TaxID=44249 RepID=UPI00096FDD22|nr:hypothetical protein [Paenibacillus odorifer]OME12111.1 hypothetical protein BSK60_18925 [Paenibacillus odorifer]